MSYAVTPYEDHDDDDQQEGEASASLTKFSHHASRRLIKPISAFMNVKLSASASFSGARAPLSDFENEAVNDLQRDLFWVLYQFRFDLLENPPQDREVTRMLLDFVLLDPLFDTKRFLLIGRQVSSAAAAYTLTTELLEDPQVGGAMGMMGKAERNEQKADDLEQPQPSRSNDEEQGEGQDSYDDDQDQQQEEDTNDYSGSDIEEPMSQQEREQMAQELREESQELREEARARMERSLSSALSSMKRSGAVREAMKTAEEIGNFLSSWGLEEGQGLELSIEEIRELMKMMSVPGLSNLTQLMGRVHGTALAVIHGRPPAQVVVETGGCTRKLHDVYRSDLAFLSQRSPQGIRNEYLKRYLSGGLSGLMRTSQAKTEGAFLWAVDGSSSMEGMIPVGDATSKEVSCHVVAKSLSLGLCRAAKDNGQKFGMFSFSSGGQLSDIVTQDSPLSDLLRFAAFDFNGGTDFDMAMTRLMDLFEALDDEDKLQADIGITTDGQGRVREDVIERLLYIKERWKCRFHMLLIGDASNKSLEPLADNVLQFTSLQDIAEVLSRAIWQ